MTIHNLFKHSTFGPEEIDVLAAAHQTALRALGLKHRDDPLTAFVAKRIILIARTGVHDANAIARRAIRELGLPEQR